MRRNFGTVRKLPSGRWQARYSTAANDRIAAPDTFPTKADAQRWLSSIETDIARGSWHDPTLGQTTVSEWADRWLATKLPTVRRATADQYEYILRMYIVPHIGDREISELTPADVQAWLGNLHRDSGLAPNTVAKVYRLLKNMLGGAVEIGMIGRIDERVGAGVEQVAGGVSEGRHQKYHSRRTRISVVASTLLRAWPAQHDERRDDPPVLAGADEALENDGVGRERAMFFGSFAGREGYRSRFD